jgi:GH24 family phage-related lysozyme (muramidase)
MGFFDFLGLGDDEKPVIKTATPNAKLPKVETLTPVPLSKAALKPVATATPKAELPFVSAAEDIAFDRLKRLEGWHKQGMKIGTEKDYTAGWGSKLKPDENGQYTVAIKKGEVLTRDQADKLARGRIRDEFIPALKKLDPNWDKKNPNQQAAMISYMYQTGPGIGTQKVSKTDPRLKKQMYVDALKSKNWKTDIPKAMLALKMSNSKMQEGVDARQKELVSLFNKPYNAEERANLIDQDLTDYLDVK